jgi:hypothetical protein
MPIRFRCAYCNQLMGIARRKAGTVVSCPKCAGQVVVPTPPPGEDDGSPEPAGQGGKDELFERSDFDKVFDNGAPANGAAAKSPAAKSPVANGAVANRPAAAPQVLPSQTAANPFSELSPKPTSEPNLPEYEAVPLSPAKKPARGIFLTPGMLLVVSGLVIVLMGLAFFLGLLLGRS